MVSTYQKTEDGRHICPNCDVAYEPAYDTKAEAKEHGTDAEREQHITGLCSDSCWNEYLGIR